MDTAETVGDILAHLSHVGVKGMKWGVRRKATVGPQEVVISDTRKKLKSTGGAGHPAHPDAISARTIGQVGKKSGLKSLSDQQLQDYARRIQLEQNVKRLNYQQSNIGKRFILSAIGRGGNQAVDTLGKKGSGIAVKQGRNALIKAGLIAAAA
jgi:hypothetical protein